MTLTGVSSGKSSRLRTHAFTSADFARMRLCLGARGFTKGDTGTILYRVRQARKPSSMTSRGRSRPMNTIRVNRFSSALHGRW